MQSADDSESIIYDELISILPNPASNYLNIVMQKDLATNVIVKITDITGRTLIDKTVTSDELFNFQLDISKLISGVYLIQLNTENHNIINRFIKN